MRIIGGKFKGAPLKAFRNIKPASFRVRKGIFDIIREIIKNSVVLDLFGGSGALGIEAFSWGAKFVVFVDIHRGCTKIIKDNVSRLKLSSSSKIILKDSFKAIKDFSSKNLLFDIIFVDPPYYKGLAKKALQTLDEYDILAPSGYIIVLCYREDAPGDCYQSFKVVTVRNYGQSRLFVYRK